MLLEGPCLLNPTHPSAYRAQEWDSIPQLLRKMRHNSVLSTCLGSELIKVMEITEGMVLGHLT